MIHRNNIPAFRADSDSLSSSARDHPGGQMTIARDAADLEDDGISPSGCRRFVCLRLYPRLCGCGLISLLFGFVGGLSWEKKKKIGATLDCSGSCDLRHAPLD